jgi:branched-chain amino acid transport system substrate-binding protein
MPYQHIFWLWVLLPLLMLATRCHPPTPPLPVTSSEPVIRIALLAPTGGELATVGRVMQNGVTMAFDELNSSGGVLGRRIEWATYDTDCTFDSAQQATQQAIAAGLMFMIGPLCSEAAIAAATVAEPAGALVIAPAATHPLVTINSQGQTRPTIFKGSYAYALQGQAAARFGREALKLSRTAVLVNPNDDYSTELAEAFAHQFTADGGRTVYQGDYAADTADFLTLLAAARQAGAELVYLPTSAAVANRVAGQLRASEFAGSLTLLGSDAWDFDALDVAAAEGSYFPVHFSPDSPQPHLQKWLDAYQARYAVAPNALAAVSYDSAYLLATAIRQADSFEPANVAQLLQRTTFEAITGPISFDAQHNPLKPAPFVKVQNGRIIYITSILP